jgi:magnesium chelatase family protein
MLWCRKGGLFYPRKRVTVNLAPAAVRKEGPAYDLPIALGVLVTAEQLDSESLDGSVQHVRGGLPMVVTARQTGFKRIVVPEVDAAEAALIPGLEVIPVGSMASLYNHLTWSGANPSRLTSPSP